MLDVLLEAYERYGPVFTLRTFHLASIWMLGPEANRFMLVTDRDKFIWRDGMMGDLIPLIGDGLLTTDGEYHDVARRIMMPSFHRDNVVAATSIMIEEAERGIDGWRAGDRVDIYDWARHVAMRVAMRALFGLDPDATGGHDVAQEFERGLSFHGTEFVLQVLRGPGRAVRARQVRPADPRPHPRRRDRPPPRGRRGRRRADDAPALDRRGRLAALRRAGPRPGADAALRRARHDHLDRRLPLLRARPRPEWRERLGAEQDALVGDGTPTGEQLFGEMPLLAQAVDETLRLYPPAWVGPRRSAVDFEFAGHRIPAGVPVNYSSWASHRLPEVFDEPHAFRPERFAPEERAKLPKGAYVPFGAGPRICIGMRFGQLEVNAIASRILSPLPARARARPGAAHPPDADARARRRPADDRRRALSRDDYRLAFSIAEALIAW